MRLTFYVRISFHELIIIRKLPIIRSQYTPKLPSLIEERGIKFLFMEKKKKKTLLGPLYQLRRYERLTYKSIPLFQVLRNVSIAPSFLLHHLQVGTRQCGIHILFSHFIPFKMRFLKFLGVLLDENLNIKEHIKYIEKKIAKNLRLLNEAGHTLEKMFPASFLQSILTYLLQLCHHSLKNCFQDKP